MDRTDYQTLTVEQKGAVDALTARVDQLNALLTEEQQKNAQLMIERDHANERLEATVTAFRADFDRHAAEIREATERWMIAKNELSALTEHLPPILADWLAPFEAFSDAGLSEEFVKRRQTVRHLLGLLGLHSI